MKTLSQNNKGLSKLMIVIMLGVIVLIIGGVIFIIIGSGTTPEPKPVTLTIWGVWDETSDFESVIDAYRKAHPYVTINYSKKRYEEYENLLISGWADEPSTGPDIYAIPNSWVNKYKERYITPLPESTKVAFYRIKKVLFKKETEIKYITEPSLTINDISRDFIDVVYNDVIFDGQIYALPLGINTLVMFYNKDLLNIAHLAQPPRTWNEFANVVSKIAIVDEQNNILRAGAALGTYDNISQASDIVTLLMLQNGTSMVTGDSVTFDQPSAYDVSYFPGEQALRFYTDFALPEKAVYTWNEQMPKALDFFAEGKLAFFFGYQYQESDIQSKSRGLNYAIASMPQVNPENEINYANYWVYTVAKKTKNIDEAWDFLQYAAEAKRVKPYLESSQQTSVLRSILNEQLADPDQSLFAQQALTAQSWYHGNKPAEAEKHFGEMIQNVVNNTMDIKQAITMAVKKIQAGYSL